MKKHYALMCWSILLAASLACGALGGSGSGSGSATGSTKFPMPSGVSNLTTDANGAVNFQTDLSLKDTLAFYRQALTKEGLTERTINTSTTDTTFSVVFDGDPSGQALVVQGVDLGNGKTNVNIRYEKV